VTPWSRGSFPFSSPFERGRSDVARAALGADLVILPTVLAHWVPELCADGCPVIGDCADILTDLTWKLTASQLKDSPLSVPSLALNHLTCRSQERCYLPLFDEVWVTSAGEVKRACELGAKHVVSLPSTNVGWNASPTSNPGSKVVGFIGNLNLDPNLDAARFLVNEVVPILRSIAPDVRLRLAGDATDPAEFESIEGVDYCGPVPDASAFVRECSVMALPIRVRGGVPLKLFEAMALGRPAVVTPQLIDGLPIDPDKDVVVADDARGFAESIARLLGDRSSRDSIGASARGAFERNFSLECAVEIASRESILNMPDPD